MVTSEEINSMGFKVNNACQRSHVTRETYDWVFCERSYLEKLGNVLKLIDRKYFGMFTSLKCVRKNTAEIKSHVGEFDKNIL